LKYNRIFRYSGSKYKYINCINGTINFSKKKIFVEPFVGSGVIFLNVNNFKKFIINDIDRNIIRIFKSFKEISFDYYQTKLNDVYDMFGSIKDNKHAYYEFRNWFNDNHWNTDTIDEGIYLMFLANSCINSFLRFGPNGMNQSYGNRAYQYNYKYDMHNRIYERLQNTEIYNLDYLKFLKVLNLPVSEYAFVLDPPYIKKKSSYDTLNENYYNFFLSSLEYLEYYYTDIYDPEILDKLKCSYKVLREKMINTGPLTHKKRNNNTECMFFNSMYFDEK